jgi:hypothetical protein
VFYRGLGPQGTPLIAASVQTTPEFHVGSRTTLFDVTSYEGATPHANYDIAPDGKNFVMVRQGQLSEIVMVQHWSEEVRRHGAAPN